MTVIPLEKMLTSKSCPTAANMPSSLCLYGRHTSKAARYPEQITMAEVRRRIRTFLSMMHSQPVSKVRSTRERTSHQKLQALGEWRLASANARGERCSDRNRLCVQFSLVVPVKKGGGTHISRIRLLVIEHLMARKKKCSI